MSKSKTPQNFIITFIDGIASRKLKLAAISAYVMCILVVVVGLLYSIGLGLAYLWAGDITGTTVEIFSPEDYPDNCATEKPQIPSNSAPHKEDMLPENTKRLPKVLIARSPSECPLWKRAFYFADVYTKDTQSDDNGNFSFLTSPCTKETYYKHGYQLTNPIKSKNSPHASISKFVTFQKNVKKIYLMTDPSDIHTQSKFSYKIKFFSSDGKQVFLANPSKTFRFSDTLQTTIPLKPDGFAKQIFHEVRTTDFRGEAIASAQIVDNSGAILSTADHSFTISEPISTREIYTNSLIKNKDKYLKLDNYSLHINAEDTWITIFDRFDTNSPHKISFIYTLNNIDTILVVQFMGVEFLIGTDKQSRIEVNTTMFNTIPVCAKILSNSTLANPLKDNIPINISISYDKNKDENFSFKFITAQDNTDTKFMQIKNLRVIQPNLILSTQQPFPAKISFLDRRSKDDKGSKHGWVSVCDFNFY